MLELGFKVTQTLVLPTLCCFGGSMEFLRWKDKRRKEKGNWVLLLLQVEDNKHQKQVSHEK